MTAGYQHWKVWLLLACLGILLAACGSGPSEPEPLWAGEIAGQTAQYGQEPVPTRDRSALMEQAAVSDETEEAYQVVEETKAVFTEQPTESHFPETTPHDDGQIPDNYDYVCNKNSLKFHYPECESVQDMNPKNRQYFSGTREDAIAQGYTPCGRCKP